MDVVVLLVHQVPPFDLEFRFRERLNYRSIGDGKDYSSSLNKQPKRMEGEERKDDVNFTAMYFTYI